MSLKSQPSIALTASTIKDWLALKYSKSGWTASVDVVSNLRDLWNQAAINSQEPRVLICYGGSTARGNFGDLAVWNREDREFLVAVTRGRGYAANRGDTLTGGDTEQVPFYTVVETVRDWLRELGPCITQEDLIDYRGVTAMQMGNLVVDGYLIKFTVAADLPQILNSPQG
jgi:hypothetical protein